VKSNIVRKIDSPPVSDPVVQPFTKDEIELILKGCLKTRAWRTRPNTATSRATGVRDKAIIMTLLDTGVRASELCGICYEDINMSSNSIKVSGKGPGRDGKERLVYFGRRTGQAIWKSLLPRIDQIRPNDPLFVVGTDADWRPLTRQHLRLLVSRIGKRVGVNKAHPHRFRHTFAINYLRNDGDVFTVMRHTKGTEYERTLGTWHQALDILMDEREGTSLPFQLFALPLNSFLDRPDWDEEPASVRWTVLTAQSNNSPQENSLSKYLSQVPKQKAHQDRIILAALLQSLRENDKIKRKARRYPTPDANFFGGIATIYTASHGEDLSEIEQAAFPWASLFLLKHYLHLHPLLKKNLAGRLSAGSRGMNWNTAIILHRMQTIVDIFLAYHGWRSDGPLLAYTGTAPWSKDDVRTFRVMVKIRHSAILIPKGEGLRPRREEIKAVEASLAWVLKALFRYM